MPLLQHLIVIEQGLGPIIQKIVIADAAKEERFKRPDPDLSLSEGGLPLGLPILEAEKHGKGANHEAKRCEESRDTAPPD